MNDIDVYHSVYCMFFRQSLKVGEYEQPSAFGSSFVVYTNVISAIIFEKLIFLMSWASSGYGLEDLSLLAAWQRTTAVGVDPILHPKLGMLRHFLGYTLLIPAWSIVILSPTARQYETLQYRHARCRTSDELASEAPLDKTLEGGYLLYWWMVHVACASCAVLEHTGAVDWSSTCIWPRVLGCLNKCWVPINLQARCGWNMVKMWMWELEDALEHVTGINQQTVSSKRSQ